MRLVLIMASGSKCDASAHGMHDNGCLLSRLHDLCSMVLGIVMMAEAASNKARKGCA